VGKWEGGPWRLLSHCPTVPLFCVCYLGGERSNAPPLCSIRASSPPDWPWPKIHPRASDLCLLGEAGSHACPRAHGGLVRMCLRGKWSGRLSTATVPTVSLCQGLAGAIGEGVDANHRLLLVSVVCVGKRETIDAHPSTSIGFCGMCGKRGERSDVETFQCATVLTFQRFPKFVQPSPTDWPFLRATPQGQAANRRPIRNHSFR